MKQWLMNMTASCFDNEDEYLCTSLTAVTLPYTVILGLLPPTFRLNISETDKSILYS